MFKGLIAIKRAASLIFEFARQPLIVLWRRVLIPVIALGYRIVLWTRKVIRFVFATLQVLFSHIFTPKHLMHIIVVTLAFLVTATNIYAGDSSSFGQDSDTVESSILSRLVGNGEEAQFTEQVSEDLPFAKDTSYLSGQALSATDAYDQGLDDPSQDILYEEEYAEDTIPSPLADAVRVQPIFDADQPSTRTKIEQYAVESGDTLASIAYRFGLKVATLMTANKLSSRDYIKPGQTLKILPVDGLFYTIKKGDTLGTIAKTYKTDVEQILAFNGYTEATGIPVGAEIILPGGVLPPPPPTPKAPTRIASNIRDVFVPPASDRKGSGKFLWPTAARRVTQYYKGARHTGVDIAGPVGTAIYAADDGVVTYAGWNSGGYGNMTIIDHGGGYFTRYGHASKMLTKVGDTVKRGDVIALVGSTGRSTGPHLHFEVMVGTIRNRVNPFDYVK